MCLVIQLYVVHGSYFETPRPTYSCMWHSSSRTDLNIEGGIWLPMWYGFNSSEYVSSPKENTSHIKCDELYFQNKVNPFQKSLIHSKIASSHSYFNINKFVKLFNFIAGRDTSEIESSNCTFLSERWKLNSWSDNKCNVKFKTGVKSLCSNFHVTFMTLQILSFL